MADRSVVVRLRAVTSQYSAAFAQAGQATTKFAKDAGAATGRTAKSLQNVQTEATITGAALLGIGVAAVAAATTFDKQMSNVRSVSNATADEMGNLRQAALDAGQATVFSASEAAQAEAELAKAGVSTSNILGGALKGSLDLAAAGGLDLANSATIAAQAMNIFDLSGRDVTAVADTLAAGANKSAADVGQLGDALRQGGLIAKQTGLGLQDTVGVLAAFADNALVGSDAGTSLKTMLMRLTPQSKEAADLMDSLGLSAYDAQGNFIGLETYAGNLRASLSKLNPEARQTALTVIFGADAARAAGVLYDIGADGVREYTDAVNDNGAASRMAGMQLDNLAGDFEQLSGSLETTFIKSGTEANGILRSLTQAATGAVNFIGDLPGPILATGLAVTTASGAFLIAAPRIANFNAQLAATPGLAKAARIGVAGIGAASAIAIGAGIVLDIQRANEENDKLKESVAGLISQLQTTGVKSDLYDQLVKDAEAARQKLVDPGWIKNVELELQSLWGAITQGGSVQSSDVKRQLLGEMQSTYTDAATALGTLNSAVGNAAGTLGVDFDRALQLANDGGITLTGTSAEMTAQIVAYAQSQAGGSAAARTAAAAMIVLADSTATAEDRLKAMKSAWDATVGVMLASSDASIAAEAAIDSLTDSLKKNGKSWDINTAKGRSNQSAFNDVIAAAGQAAQAKADEGKGTEVVNATYDRYLRKLLKTKGLTDEQRTAVRRLISEGYNKLPKEKETKVTADTSQATAAVDALQAKLNVLKTPIGIRVVIDRNGDVLGRGTGMGGGTAPKKKTTASAPPVVTPPKRGASTTTLADPGLIYRAATTTFSGSASGGNTYNVTAVAAPGERAEETVPRALRRQAFLNGMGG